MARNSIILNGKSSDTITGLIIQELPPISKPLMRSQVEEIDGRDGDIITKLGFSAYDKEISVGLYGNFDINEIIAYFNSEGTVTFSNEPDKFYYYQILDQIDFERLVRFRTATINFHVQPFKYSTTEEAETIEAGTVSGEGNNIVLENTSDNPFSKLTPKGDTYQNGNPTPDNPIAVQVVTGEQTVKVVGKNLLPLVSQSFHQGSLYYSVDAGRLKLTGSRNAEVQKNASVFKNNFSFKLAAGTYTVSCAETGSKSGTINLYLLDKSDDSTLVTITKNGSNSLTLAQETEIYLGIYSYQLTITDSVLYALQIEQGSAPSAWQSYQSQSYPISLGSTELAKIGTYQDYIWKDGSDWKIHKATGHKQLDVVVTGIRQDGNAHADYVSYAGAFAITGSAWNNAGGDYNNDITNARQSTNCGQYELQTISGNANANSMKDGTFCQRSGTNDRIYMRFSSLAGKTGAELKAILSAQGGSDFYYYLATPTDTAITDETLIGQLEALNAAHAYKGRTHIISTAGSDANLPHIIEAKVLGSSDTTITNAGNFISKPKFTIYGSGNIGLYINGIQILQIALGDEQYITIDAAQMEAYKDTLDNLKNRLVTGDYTNLALNPGENQISFSGSVEKYIVENYSRWL